jgi:hypothetical protein
LHMTYVFEFRLPDVKEGSEEAEKEAQRLKGVSIPLFFSIGISRGRVGVPMVVIR